MEAEKVLISNSEITSPKVFISFTSQDSKNVRMLFYALKQQEVEVWDYSGRGQELPLGKSLEDTLKERIDSSDYFIAVISPRSINEQSGRYALYEVQYAIESAKYQQNKILPIVLNDSGDPWSAWETVYEKLRSIKRIELDSTRNDSFEDHLREICGWLAIKYIPSALRNKKTFFAETFLSETEEITDLRHADFVQLMNIMDRCASDVENGNWVAAKERAELFLLLAGYIAPQTNFFYPLVIRGVCELELKEIESAKRTFIAATDPRFKGSPFYGLGFAGLGQTLFTAGQFDEASQAYNRATELLKGDKLALINQINSLIHAGSDSWNEAEIENFDQMDLPAEHRLKLLKLKGIAKYKKHKFSEAAGIFGATEADLLDETAAIYYALSLIEVGRKEFALDMLLKSAARLNSVNIYHYLADSYLRCNFEVEALSVYHNVLCNPAKPDNWKRQYFIEYARLLLNRDPVRFKNLIRDLCEKVLDFDLFSLPDSKEEFFYLGFASYLLGRFPEAYLDYQRSSGFCNDYYNQLI